MLTKTIGQLTAASSLTSVDLLEVEIAGASKKVDVGMVGDALTATSAESLLGSSNDVFITPATFRAGINAENTAPVYACRAWATSNTTTTSSSLSGTYTRIVGTTLTVCVATAHGMITGNVQYIDFVTGGGSDNTYIVTVTDADTFTVNTVSTSSILTSTLSLKRCPILYSGNINNVSYISTGRYAVNFNVEMPVTYYSTLMTLNGVTANAARGIYIDSDYPQTKYAFKVLVNTDAPAAIDPDILNIAVFA